MQVSQAIAPCLWFDDQGEDAAKFYTAIFPNSKVVAVSRYSDAGQEVHGKKGYTEALRHELRPFNIAAVIVAPGPVSTPAGDKAMRAEKHIPEYADRRQKADDLSVRGIRGGMDPKRVAETILKVVKSDWPSPRYAVGLQSRATNLAHGLLPPSTFEAAVRWGVGLG